MELIRTGCPPIGISSDLAVSAVRCAGRVYVYREACFAFLKGVRSSLGCLPVRPAVKIHSFIQFIAYTLYSPIRPSSDSVAPALCLPFAATSRRRSFTTDLTCLLSRRAPICSMAWRMAEMVSP